MRQHRPVPKPLRVALIVLLCDMISASLVYPSMPSLIRELGDLSAQQAAVVYGLIIGLSAATALFSSPVLGALSDRYGRRPILALSCAGSAVALLAAAVSPNLALLALGYFLASLISAMFVVVNAVVADTLEPEDRHRGYSYGGAVFGIGFVIGPALGALLAPLGLRAPFLAGALLMTLATIAALLFLPESLPVEKRKRELDLKQLWFWRALGSLRAYPLVARLVPTFFLNSLALNMLIGVWVPFGTYQFGFGVAQNGWVLAALGLSAALAQATFVPGMVKRLGTYRAVSVGILFSTLSYAGYALAPTVVAFIAVLVISSFGALDEPALQGAASGAVPETDQGTVQGALATVGGLMGIVGPILGTAIFGVTTGPKAALHLPGATFLIGAVCVLVGGILALRALKRTPVEQTP